MLSLHKLFITKYIIFWKISNKVLHVQVTYKYTHLYLKKIPTVWSDCIVINIMSHAFYFFKGLLVGAFHNRPNGCGKNLRNIFANVLESCDVERIIQFFIDELYPFNSYTSFAGYLCRGANGVLYFGSIEYKIY